MSSLPVSTGRRTACEPRSSLPDQPRRAVPICSSSMPWTTMALPGHGDLPMTARPWRRWGRPSSRTPSRLLWNRASTRNAFMARSSSATRQPCWPTVPRRPSSSSWAAVPPVGWSACSSARRRWPSPEWHPAQSSSSPRLPHHTPWATSTRSPLPWGRRPRTPRP